MTRKPLSEVRIPARAEFIPVAKRVASTLGGQLGFSLEEVDELGIAVVQACDSAIESSGESWGEGGSLKLTYSATDRGIEVEVQALPPRSPHGLAPAPRPPVVREEAELRRVSQEMIRCFVDDFRSSTRGGRVRYRMVKYLITS